MSSCSARASSTWFAWRARARRQASPGASRSSTSARPGRCPALKPTPEGNAMHALDLVPVWTIILGVAVFMYVLLDGFDLGIGILFPMARDDDARTLMMASVAPIWDGNETWLVLGGLGLLAI